MIVLEKYWITICYFLHIGQLCSISRVDVKDSDWLSDAESMFGPHPLVMVCDSCQQEIITELKYKVGCSTWFMCIAIFIAGGCVGYCLFPFWMKSCKTVLYHCPQCNKMLRKRRQP